ncbi:endolytic transglycosylase MltG [Phaeacidiphilus oryzae]|uniref:endolytic transglycosylase MltG n=1 Tax=Phaeacidiphilus oryzae TaxID=348818 RepID=UPI00055FADA8|nr:endolytic transglycosylase MltG [Phaeacidiphilus oryzae]
MTDHGREYGSQPWGADPLYGDPYGDPAQQPQHPGQGYQQPYPQQQTAPQGHYPQQQPAPGYGGYADPDGYADAAGYGGGSGYQDPAAYPDPSGYGQYAGQYAEYNEYAGQAAPAGPAGYAAGYPAAPGGYSGYQEEQPPYGRPAQQTPPQQSGWQQQAPGPYPQQFAQPAPAPAAPPAEPAPYEQEPEQDWPQEPAPEPRRPGGRRGQGDSEAVADPDAGEDTGLGFLGDADTGEEAERRRDKQGKKSRKRNGCACLVVAAVLLGGVGGAGWYGYKYWESRFGPPPDWNSVGTGSVQVEIKQGDSLSQMGDTLVTDDVVKSERAFVKSATAKGANIQPGFYTLKHHMSADSAVALLANIANSPAVIVSEGMRATQVYTRIDDKLHLAKGTTAKVAKQDAGRLGLPAYAHDNPEGFLFPSRYNVGAGTKPLDLLKQMVSEAEQQYSALGIENGAPASGLHNAYDVIVEASIVQAEGQDSADFAKISRVLYNRLHSTATNGKLEMDSTINYALNRSTLTTTSTDQRTPSPYNTYLHQGLPPGPIGNPGADAIQAVLHPATGDWLYFVTVKPGDTRFTASYAQHLQNVAAFNAYQKEHGN